MAAAAAAPAKLQIVRLTRDETSVRPIPVLAPPGGLAGAEPAALVDAPARPPRKGPFNAFCTDGGPPGQLWVVRVNPNRPMNPECPENPKKPFQRVLHRRRAAGAAVGGARAAPRCPGRHLLCCLKVLPAVRSAGGVLTQTCL